MTARDGGGLAPTATGSGDIGARLALVVLCLLWGVTWPVMKIALTEIPPLPMRTMTTAFGALTLLAICAVRRRSLRLPNARTWGHVVIMSILNITAFSILSAFAQMTAATSRVAILIYTMPIWTVLLGWLVLRDRPTRAQVIALALCIVGLTILIYPLARNGVPLGLLLALASGVSWAAGTLYVKWLRLDADPLVVTTWQVIIAFFIIGACLLVFDGLPDLGAASARALSAAVFSGVIGSGIAYALWFEIVRRLPAATASLGVLGNPAVGVISTILILGERPTATDLVGFALILAASACVLIVPRTRQAAIG